MSLKDKLPDDLSREDELYAVVDGEVTSKDQVNENGLELKVLGFYTDRDEASGKVSDFHPPQMVIPVDPGFFLD